MASSSSGREFSVARRDGRPRTAHRRASFTASSSSKEEVNRGAQFVGAGRRLRRLPHADARSGSPGACSQRARQLALLIVGARFARACPEHGLRPERGRGFQCSPSHHAYSSPRSALRVRQSSRILLLRARHDERGRRIDLRAGPSLGSRGLLLLASAVGEFRVGLFSRGTRRDRPRALRGGGAPLLRRPTRAPLLGSSRSAGARKPTPAATRRACHHGRRAGAFLVISAVATREPD